ncbi:hypothetical protein M885DRAFT_531286 [Pelagophyceae sp. CCMP2097]|nr:hypothetical protein M885DRAFT_531286 [Pelagophyceae sp. CCMP2097]|mmetsp:Transcript_25201/g.86374  ORF Transcript_25201/g.86374 Transcript_25201/m.86374 type:complete len:452 (-) Transcript_25201:178-1533(-)
MPPFKKKRGSDTVSDGDASDRAAGKRPKRGSPATKLGSPVANPGGAAASVARAPSLGSSKSAATFQKKQSRVGNNFQVQNEELWPATHNMGNAACLWRPAPPPSADALASLHPRASRAEGADSVWILERVDDACDYNTTAPLDGERDALTTRQLTIALKRGRNVLGRSRETQLSDLRLSRQHVELTVDDAGNVWLAPLSRVEDVVSINQRACKKADGRQSVERGDVIRLWIDTYGFRLVHAAADRRAPAAEAADDDLAEVIWRPPPADLCAAVDDVLDLCEPGAEEPTLRALHATEYRGGIGSLARQLATQTAGSCAIQQRWGSDAVAAFSASMLRNRKELKYVAAELEVTVGELLHFYYAVWKPRHDNVTFKALLQQRLDQQRVSSAPPDDGHSNECAICGGGGELLCCDTCELAYHLPCVELEAIPDGEWRCPRCRASTRPRNSSPPVS